MASIYSHHRSPSTVTQAGTTAFETSNCHAPCGSIVNNRKPQDLIKAVSSCQIGLQLHKPILVFCFFFQYTICIIFVLNIFCYLLYRYRKNVSKLFSSACNRSKSQQNCWRRRTRLEKILIVVVATILIILVIFTIVVAIKFPTGAYRASLRAFCVVFKFMSYDYV